MPHKSPGPKALVSSGSDTQRWMSLNLAMDDMFRDDVSMDSFLGQIGNGKTDAFLIDGLRQWKFVLTTVLT